MSRRIDGDNNIKEMSIMNHEALVQAEIEYRRQILLEQAGMDRIAKEIRARKSARSS